MNLQIESPLISGLIDFLDNSPTPWHAVDSATKRLTRSGFVQLSEVSGWTLEPGVGYFVTRSDGALIAWRQPKEVLGWTIFGAHTDSPNLRLRPKPVLKRHGYFELSFEVYGGALYAPWFDRELSLAGRVVISDDGVLKSKLIDFRRSIGVIPSLAIHLDRDANLGRKINPQDELTMLIGRADSAVYDRSIPKCMRTRNYVFSRYGLKCDPHQGKHHCIICNRATQQRRLSQTTWYLF